MIKEEEYEERKSKLELFIIDISDLRVNPSKVDYLPFEIEVGVTFDFHVNDTPIKKEIVKITKNNWLDLKYIFIKTAE